MKSRWIVAVAVVAAVSAVSVPNGHGQGRAEAQSRHFEYQGERFEIRPLQENEAVFEIIYGEIRGYLGVPEDATDEFPFGFATVYPNFDIGAHTITPQWLSGLGKCTGDDCFTLIGAAMLETHRSWTDYQESLEAQRELQADNRQAADELGEIVGALPPGR